MSALGGKRIASLTCHFPPSGGWRAVVSLEVGGVPALGLTTLTIADLELVGSVVLADEETPGVPRAVVYGGAGWRLPLPAPGGSYQSPGGVRLSTVLRDLAALADEPYVQPAETVIGQAFSWPASTPRARVTGRTVLSGLVAQGALTTWRVATDGNTRFDSWPSLGAADGKARVVNRNVAVGARRLGLDTVASAFLPGGTFEDVTIRRVIFTETSGELIAEVWAA